MFYQFKIVAENIFDKFIWRLLPPPTNKNLATALTSYHIVI